MDEPRRLHGCQCDPELVLVEDAPVRRTIEPLTNNKGKTLALKTLELECP
jgi:hypothetical protein